MTHDEIMNEVVKAARNCQGVLQSELEYPGYVHILDNRKRAFCLGFDGQNWSVDCYKDEQQLINGLHPSYVTELSVLDAMNVEEVTNSIMALIDRWN